MSFIRLATRKSRLALFQSNLVRQEIQAADPTVEVELVEVTTTGDQKRDWSLEKQGGTGLFTKELESLLLDGVADIAVHSSGENGCLGIAIAYFVKTGFYITPYFNPLGLRKPGS